MASTPLSISPLAPAFTSQDYHALRLAGVEHLRQLAGGIWTDHNSHDPGITLLEALCYAITDLGHRTGMDMQDLLADRPDETHPLRNFFTLAEDIPMPPLTLEDYRKFLLDQPEVRNAWLTPDADAEVPLYLDRTAGALTYSAPGNERLRLQGLNRVVIEWEPDPVLGDLNSFSQVLRLSLSLLGGPAKPFDIEVQFPHWKETPAALDSTAIGTVDLQSFWPVPGDTSSHRVEWEVNSPGGIPIPLMNVRVLSPMDSVTDLADFRTQLQAALDNTPVIRDAFAAFVSKRSAVRDRCATLRNALNAHRNLCEDFVEVSPMDVQEIGITLDLRVAPGADIHRIQGEVYHRVGRFLNPTLRFRSLREMLELGKRPEEIFTGPLLSNGFLLAEELRTHPLRDALYTSDLVNEIMDIPGVTAVDTLLLSNFVKGTPIGLDAADCLLLTTPGRLLPRLSPRRSLIRFDKGDRILRLAKEELAQATLRQLTAHDTRLKGAYTAEDMPIPAGLHLGVEQYTSLQNDLPQAYGIGEYGLPSDATAERKAQAFQLKAFLALCEQLLANYLAQLSRLRRIFSLQEMPGGNGVQFAQGLYSVPAIANVLKGFITTYGTSFTEADWATYLAASPTPYLAFVQEEMESEAQYHQRRNQFLDHLIARFNETFADYTLWVLSTAGEDALPRLIRDKSTFLSDHPAASAERAHGPALHIFPGGPGTKWPSEDNVAGLKKRVSRLLGFDSYAHQDMAGILEHTVVAETTPGQWTFVLNDDTPDLLLESPGSFSTEAKADAALQLMLDLARDRSQYRVGGTLGAFVLELVNASSTVVARKTGFATAADATDHLEAVLDFVLTWDEVESFHIVEQVLMRPATNTDALMPVFVNPLRMDHHTLCRWDGIERMPDVWPPRYPAAPLSLMDSKMCSGPLFDGLVAAGKMDHLLNPTAPCMEIADPYSFRICVVMPAWTKRFQDAAFRKLFRHTTRLETPAHIFVKFVWMDRPTLRNFENTYADWLHLKAGHTVTGDPLAALMDICSGVCSVYDAKFESTWTGKVSDLRAGDTVAVISDPDGEPTEARLLPGASLPPGIVLHPFTGDLIVKDPATLTAGLYTNISVGYWNSSGDHHCVRHSITIKPERDTQVQESPPRPINTYLVQEVVATLVSPDRPIVNVLPAAFLGLLPPGIAFRTSTNEFYVADVQLLEAGTWPITLTTVDDQGGTTDLSFSLRLLPASGGEVLQGNRLLDPPQRLPIGTVLFMVHDSDNGVDAVSFSPDVTMQGTGISAVLVADVLTVCEVRVSDPAAFQLWLEANDDLSDPLAYTVNFTLSVQNANGGMSTVEHQMRVARNATPAFTTSTPKNVELYLQGNLLATLTDATDGGILSATSEGGAATLLQRWGLALEIATPQGGAPEASLVVADPITFKRAAKERFSFDPNVGLIRTFDITVTDSRGNTDVVAVDITVTPDPAPAFTASPALKLDTYVNGSTLGTFTATQSGGITAASGNGLEASGLEMRIIPGPLNQPASAVVRVANQTAFRRALTRVPWEALSDPGKLSATFRFTLVNGFGGTHTAEVTLQVLDEMDAVFLQLHSTAAISDLPQGECIFICKGFEPWSVDATGLPDGISLELNQVTSYVRVTDPSALLPGTYNLILSGINYNEDDFSLNASLTLTQRVLGFSHSASGEGMLTLTGEDLYPGLAFTAISLSIPQEYGTATLNNGQVELTFTEAFVNAGVVVTGTLSGEVASHQNEPVQVQVNLRGAGGGYRRHTHPLFASLAAPLVLCTPEVAAWLPQLHTALGTLDADIFPQGWPNFGGDSALQQAYTDGLHDFAFSQLLLPTATSCADRVVALAALLQQGTQLTDAQSADLTVCGALLAAVLATLTEFALHIRQTDILPGTDLHLVLAQVLRASQALN